MREGTRATARPVSGAPTTADLRNVILADLSDGVSLLALHQHAVARGWLQGGEAAQLNVVAAAVHARRVGDAPCRLFVALLRDQRWEVITQEDEDQACRLLREHRDGPPHARERQPPSPRSPCLTTRALCCEPSTCCAKPDGAGSCSSG